MELKMPIASTNTAQIAGNVAPMSDLISGSNGRRSDLSDKKSMIMGMAMILSASRRFIVSSTIYYSTGRPVTYPVAKYQIGDQVILHYSKFNQYRIPDYFRMDLSFRLEGNLKKNKLLHSTLTFSLYNITARKNAYSVYFRSKGGNFEAYKLSIFGTVIPTVNYQFRF